MYVFCSIKEKYFHLKKFKVYLLIYLFLNFQKEKEIKRKEEYEMKQTKK